MTLTATQTSKETMMLYKVLRCVFGLREFTTVHLFVSTPLPHAAHTNCPAKRIKEQKSKHIFSESLCILFALRNPIENKMLMEIIGNCSNKYKSCVVLSVAVFVQFFVCRTNMWKLIQYNLLPISESIFTTDIHIWMRKWRAWRKPKSTIATHWIIFSRFALRSD